jgi:hypothetical protein
VVYVGTAWPDILTIAEFEYILIPNRKRGGEAAAFVAEFPALDQRQLCLRGGLDAATSRRIRGTPSKTADASAPRFGWRNQLGGVAPAHLPKWLLVRVLAYRVQATAFARRAAVTREGAALIRFPKPPDGIVS